MLQLLYIIAFTILALIAVSNLIRNLLMFSFEREPRVSRSGLPYISSRSQSVPHPELLDNSGNVVKDPLLVMRSINVDDAREQLDALYKASPSYKETQDEEA